MGSTRSGRVAAAVIAAVILATSAMPALGTSPGTAAVPPPLSRDTTPNDLSSTFGSGDFGQWRTDQFGLPAYRYTMDQQVDPRARQVETGGTTTFHQVGNDAHHAFATNDGYTQLWSQARLYQWTNYYQPSAKHYAGGYGYRNVGGGNGLSTLFADRPAGATTERDFGVGYCHHSMTTAA